jgi:deazaflavin-dependent oxidoreductase (nitroreductase family)
VIPPRWAYRLLWAAHGIVDRLSGGRLSTRRPRGNSLGLLYLETLGRRSGRPRRNALYYMEQGPNLLVIASNAGDDAQPAWWLNLQAQPKARVTIAQATRRVRARAATPEEAADAWRRFTAASRQYAAYRSATHRSIAVVVLEPDG